MAHLTPARLVDLAEGAVAEHSVPHLVECAACRRVVVELRATMADAVRPENEVPEPSPLFWDHLSARVHEGVAELGAPSGRWFERWLRPRVALSIFAAAAGAAVIAVVVSRTPRLQSPIPATSLPIDERAQLPSLPPLEPLGAADDAALGLLADYGTSLAWDDMREEMALVTHVGSTDEAVTTLSADEREELQHLLEEEMSQPSALGAS
jgi:hypothetical protein